MKARVLQTILTLALASACVAGAQQPGRQPSPNPHGNPNFPPGHGKSDITDLKKGIIIGGAIGGAGGKFVPWGTVADLSDVDPIPGTIVGGRCAFNATYVEINIGAGATSPLYTNKLKLDSTTDVAINTS